jgi:hypothetical protein
MLRERKAKFVHFLKHDHGSENAGRFQIGTIKKNFKNVMISQKLNINTFLCSSMMARTLNLCPRTEIFNTIPAIHFEMSPITIIF